MYMSSIVHLPHINQLLSSRPCNLVWQLLVAKCLPSGLDDIHLVSGAGCSRSKVLKTGESGEFEDEMLASETET